MHDPRPTPPVPLVRIGDPTPWGTAEAVERIAPGIERVHTETSGGIRLSPARDEQLPAPFRKPGRWYPEGDGAAACRYAFPREFADALPGAGPARRVRDAADRVLRDTLPDQWTLVHGRPLTAGESREIADREFADAHQGEFVAVRIARPGVLDPALAREARGWCLVAARRAADGAERVFLVPAAEARGSVFTVDPDECREWTVADRPAATVVGPLRRDATGSQPLASRDQFARAYTAARRRVDDAGGPASAPAHAVERLEGLRRAGEASLLLRRAHSRA